MQRTRWAPARRLAGALCAGLLLAGCGGAAGPSPRSSAAGSPVPSATSGPATPTPVPSPTFAAYVVQPGDSLTSIARRFSTTGRSIAFWNRARYPSLDPLSVAYAPDAIQVGWTLQVLPGGTVDETGSLPPGPPSPSAVPTPRPSIVLPTQPPAGAPSIVVEHGPRGSGLVALTFDVGGGLTPDPATVQWLADHRIPATFLVGGAATTGTDAGRQVLTIVAAHRDLFRVGDGGWDASPFVGLTAAAIADQLQRTEAAVAPLAGSSTKPFVRPPYGAQDAAVLAATGAAGWAYLVLWDVEPLDGVPEAQGGPTTDDIVARILSRAQGGSIVHLHLGGQHTLEALPAIVDGLRARGLDPATLGELLGA
ncbi:MAG TPA: polysaccharide deacetylase family protein [Candidatus Limnocylindrales bacterium]